MNKRIDFKYSIIIVILCVLCIPYNFAFGFINTIVTVVAGLSALYSFLYIIYGRYYRDQNMMYLWLLLLWECLATVINATDVIEIIKRSSAFFSVSVLTYLLIKKNNKNAIISISTIFTIIMLLQFLTYVTHVLGYSEDQSIDNIYNYFLGIRVNINKIILFSFFFTIWNYKLNPQTGIIKLIIVVTTGLCFVIGEGVSTSLVGVALYGTIFLISRIIKEKRIWKVVIFVLFCIVVGFAFVRKLGHIQLFQYILVDLLNETTSFNGRFSLWEQTINNIRGIHWLIGNGYGNRFIFTLGIGFRTNLPHNQYLEILFNYGVVGAVFYILMLSSQVKVAVNRGYEMNVNLLACIISTLIINVPAHTADMVYFYIFYTASLFANSVTTDKYRKVGIPKIRFTRHLLQKKQGLGRLI